MYGLLVSVAESSPGLYLGWGSFTIQFGNLVIIVLMVVFAILYWPPTLTTAKLPPRISRLTICGVIRTSIAFSRTVRYVSSEAMNGN